MQNGYSLRRSNQESFLIDSELLFRKYSTVENDNLSIIQRCERYCERPNAHRNYMCVETGTKIAINKTNFNDQDAVDAANNHCPASSDETKLFRATPSLKANASTSVQKRGQLIVI